MKSCCVLNVHQNSLWHEPSCYLHMPTLNSSKLVFLYSSIIHYLPAYLCVNLPQNLPFFTLLYFITYLHTFVCISLKSVLDLTTAHTCIPLCESPSKLAFPYSSILHYLPAYLCVYLPQNCPWLNHCTNQRTFVWISFKTCLSLLFYTSLPICIPLCESSSKLSLT